MSLKTMLRVWEHSQTQRAARCLMLALADFANDDGICWPGTASLAKKINEAPDYTDTIIKKCIDMGELAKEAGHGRGHKTRFAVLCGLDTDAQKRLKGVLQKGYSSTPFVKGVAQAPLSQKRGTPKGVLFDDKRGTFSDSKQASFDALGSSESPFDEKMILHDPNHGDGDGARALEKYLSSLPMFPATVAQILALNLDPPTVIAACDMLRAAGWGIGAIADHIRKYPPVKGQPYEQQPIPSNDRARARRADRQPDATGATLPERGPIRSTLDY